MVDMGKRAGRDRSAAADRDFPGVASGLEATFDDTMRRLIPSAEKPTVDFIDTQTQAADRLSETFGRYLHELAARGVELTALGEPERVATHIIEGLPLARSRMAAAVGPCYTSGGLQATLRTSRAAVSKAVIERRALRLVTTDGRNVYPAFQVRHGALMPGLRKVLLALSEAIDDPWTWAIWLNAPVSEGSATQRRIDQLSAGDIDGTVREASRTAASWAA